MADSRAISQLEAQGYPWIGCECCKGTVWVPFRMLRDRIPMLSAMTLDQLGARMRCDKCDKRARAILSCKSERHGRVCSKDLDSPLEEERDAVRGMRRGIPASLMMHCELAHRGRRGRSGRGGVIGAIPDATSDHALAR